jgi:hypothetical protein
MYLTQTYHAVTLFIAWHLSCLTEMTENPNKVYEGEKNLENSEVHMKTNDLFCIDSLKVIEQARNVVLLYISCTCYYFVQVMTCMLPSYNVSYVVKRAPNVKNTFTSHIDKKNSFTFKMMPT